MTFFQCVLPSPKYLCKRGEATIPDKCTTNPAEERKILSLKKKTGTDDEIRKHICASLNGKGL